MGDAVQLPTPLFAVAKEDADPLLSGRDHFFEREAFKLGLGRRDYAIDIVSLDARQAGNDKAVPPVITFSAEDRDPSARWREFTNSIKNPLPGPSHQRLRGNTDFLARSSVDQPAVFGASNPHRRRCEPLRAWSYATRGGIVADSTLTNRIAP